MGFLRRSSAILLVLVLLPSLAYAQAAITGVVKDTSGAVLPGATVEAASPVLIEKVRSVVSDDTGQYRIVDLRPGIYSVTFSLPGFSSVKREGIELSGTFVATVNADLRIGSLQETITVTGETPIVDVQSAKVQTTIRKDILADRGLHFRALDVDDWRLAGDGDGFLERADSQIGVDRRDERAAQLDAFALHRTEAGQRERHGIDARTEIDDSILTCVVADDRANFFNQHRTC